MDNTQILRNFGEQLVNEFRSKIPKVSGKTAQSIKIRSVTPVSLTIEANRYLPVLWTGRKPGKMPPVQEILEWVKKKGIKVPNQTRLAWAISKSIAKSGTIAFKQGGKKNPLTDRGVDNRISKLADMLGERKSIEISSDIVKEFKR